MLGENLVDYITDNKKSRREEAVEYLTQLRSFSKEEVQEDPWEYLDILTAFLTIVNDKDPMDTISYEDIGTNEKEIRGFEEKSLIIESKTF